MAGKLRVLSFFLFLIISSGYKIISQPVDSVSFGLNSRYSFYSHESNGEMLLYVPQNLLYNNISVSLEINNENIGSWKGVPVKKIVRVPFTLYIQQGDQTVTATIKVSGRNIRYVTNTRLIKLNYKPNEVKTDRLTGGLIVNKREFFPFGFYTYTPVQPTLPEEEVVKGLQHDITVPEDPSGNFYHA